LKPKKPRTKLKEVRISEIQEAAKGVFFKRGYQKSSVDEIAKIAGISKGTIYFYFKNKEDLYLSLMLPMFQEVTRLLLLFEKKVDKDLFQSSYDFFMEFSKILLRAYKSDPDGFMVFRAFQVEDFFSKVSRETFDKLNDVARKNNLIAQRIMHKAINKGLLPPSDTIKLADISWGLFLGVMQVELDKLRWTKKDHINDTLEYAFTLISKGIQKEK
jgi:AcrR family transcriptional regulator